MINGALPIVKDYFGSAETSALMINEDYFSGNAPQPNSTE